MVMVRVGEVERCFTVFSHIILPPSTLTLTPHLCHCLLIPGEDGPQVNQLTRHAQLISGHCTHLPQHMDLGTVPHQCDIGACGEGRGGEGKRGRRGAKGREKGS